MPFVQLFIHSELDERNKLQFCLKVKSKTGWFREGWEVKSTARAEIFLFPRRFHTKGDFSFNSGIDALFGVRHTCAYISAIKNEIQFYLDTRWKVNLLWASKSAGWCERVNGVVCKWGQHKKYLISWTQSLLSSVTNKFKFVKFRSFHINLTHDQPHQIFVFSPA